MSKFAKRIEDIDWSEMPEGATEFVLADDKYLLVWLKEGGGLVWGYSYRKWRACNTYDSFLTCSRPKHSVEKHKPKETTGDHTMSEKKHEYLVRINYKSGNSVVYWFESFKIRGDEVAWKMSESHQGKVDIVKFGVDNIESVHQLDAREVDNCPPLETRETGVISSMLDFNHSNMRSTTSTFDYDGVCRIKKQKNLALYLMRHVEEQGLPQMYLAGGAPRNWYFDKEAKDLDFYIEGEMSYEIFRMLSEAGVDFVKYLNLDEMREEGCGENYTSCDSVSAILYGELCGQELQVMFTKDFTKTVDQEFSTNICKIWCYYSEINNDLMTVTTDEFATGVVDKRLVFTEGYDKDHRHCQKMIGYFPDYSY